MTSSQFRDLLIIFVCYSIIRATVADSRIKINPKITFSIDRKQATLAFELTKSTYVYDVIRNDRLFRDSISEQENCYYDDALKGPWAAIRTCNSQINGAIDVDGKLLEIVFDTKTNAHFLTEFSNTIQHGNDDLERDAGSKDDTNDETRKGSGEDDILIPNYGPRDISVGFHADIEFVKNKLGDPNADVYEIMRQVMLLVARHFAPTNILISSKTELYRRDEMTLHKDMNKQLKEFSALVEGRPYDYGGFDINGLLTGHHFPATPTYLGLAFIKGLCIKGANTFIVTSTDGQKTKFATPMSLAQVITHELGHNIGLKHDTQYDPECPCFTASTGHRCIMNNESFPAPYDWSDCTFNLLLEFSKKTKGCVNDVRDATREPFRLMDVATSRLFAFWIGFSFGVVLVLVATAAQKVTSKFFAEESTDL